MISLVKDNLTGSDPFRTLLDYINDKADAALQIRPDSETRIEFIRNFFNDKSASILGKTYTYVQKARRIFAFADENNDGILDVPEFKKFAPKLCKQAFSDFDAMGLNRPTKVDILSDFKALDVDRSGTLDFDEFFRFMQVIMLASLATSIDEKLELVANAY